MESSRSVTTGLLVALMLLAVALLAAGCGGSSPATTTTLSAATSPAKNTIPTPIASTIAKGTLLTRAELVSRAEAICTKTNVALLKNKPANTSPKETLRVAPKSVALERNAVTELEKLKPPASLGQEWTSIVSLRQVLLQELALLIKEAKKSNSKGITNLGTLKENTHAALLKAGIKPVFFKACREVG